MINDQDTPRKMERVSRNQVETNERFYKIPKALFENEFYADMKLETKMAYAILHDRFLLSIKNNWIDKNGDVYLIYKNSDLQTILSVGEKKVISLKKELADFGLLEEERQGLNKPNRLYVGNINVDFEVIHRVSPLGDKELSKRQSSETNLSETETNSFDEDEVTDNNNSQKSQQSFIAIGKIIQTNPELRSVVQSLIPDLLLNEPQQAEIVVRALDRGYHFLTTELEKGNSVLTLQKQLQGVAAIKQFLLSVGYKQVDYMHDHLIDISQYGKYFTSGFENRLKIAITTSQLASGF
ncbi:replication initiator protein A [Leuconostoc mesenteroides]|uniref:replication initiator protein A n=1 Tax=Leuconostoc mesenteroides TaxID=1245 RepID=UPI0009FBAB8B|nr:replication initiator protein A [Leuconostoc mesenteroides]ARN63444.1 Replication initiator protein A [Leuconostoc mesenteroides subsp. mesenteroides]MCJ2159742.1 replication initiator protein A [Leuconostoc mesenteroides]MCM6835402.1 replication initiator protein A [Leuconostoc mesenteroides]MDV8926675.1 replication initiator protein A [Leuconostoc mesenteroides]RDG14836.1 Replication initiator protein A [Leuconostoc mesenteroides subsp. mesenteroides]